MNICKLAALAAIVLGVGPFARTCFAAAPMSAKETKEVIEAVAAASLAIQTIECRFATYVARRLIPGAEPGPNDLGLLTAFTWGWDRATGRQYIKGRWGFRSSKANTFTYQDLHFVYNGSVMKGVGGHGGEIHPSPGNTFLRWGNPLVLVGVPLAGGVPPRTLSEVFEQMESPAATNEGELVVIRGRMHREKLSDLHLVAWIDPNRGLLPVRIETRRIDTGTLKRLIEVDEFAEPKPGVWMPLRGRITDFYAQAQVPSGTTKQEYEKALASKLPPEVARMTKSERKALPLDFKRALLEVLGLRFQAKPLGLGTRTIIVDPSSVRVNEPIPAERFDLEFPPGLLIWNGIEQRSERVAHRAPAGGMKSGSPWPLFFWLSSAALLIAAVVFWRSRSRRRTRGAR